MLSLTFLLLLKKLSQTRYQSQKNALMAVCTSIGAVCSLTVGGLVAFLTQIDGSVYWATVIISFILIPFSWLVGIKIWDFLRSRWFESDDLLFRIKFLEEEYHRVVRMIDQSGFPQEIAAKEKKKLLDEYNRARLSILGRKVHKIKTVNR